MQRIIKTDTSNQTATFVILEPDLQDFNGQTITEDEIIKTAHEFVRNLSDKYVNIDHENDTKQADVVFVESFVTPVELELGGDTIKKWSWLVAFKFLTASKWQALLDGEFVGVSMEWYGYVD